MSSVQTNRQSRSWWKTPPRFVFVSLIAGLVMSVLQAWGSLLVYDFGGLYPLRPSSYIEAIRENRIGQFGTPTSRINAIGPVGDDGKAWWYIHRKYRYGIQTAYCSNPSVTLKQMQEHIDLYTPFVEVVPPAWSVSRAFPTQIDKERYPTEYEVVAGWPMTALYGSARIEGEIDRPKLRWAWSYADIQGQHPIIMPYKPLVGFVINTLFYAVIAWVTVVVFHILKSCTMNRLRSRRAHCSNCGYDSRGLSTCPECGEKIDPEKLPTLPRRNHAVQTTETHADP